MTRDEWQTTIARRMGVPPTCPRVATINYVFPTDSLPLQVTATDGNDYVVKLAFDRPRPLLIPVCDPPTKPGGYMKAVMTNEQLVGRLSESIGAPTPRTTLVSVDQPTLDAHEAIIQTEHDKVRAQWAAKGHPSAGFARVDYRPGIAHASEFISTIGPRQGVDFVEGYPANRERLARLAVLYGLVGIADSMDLQLFYDDDTRLVYSLDHGHAFGGVPFWTLLSTAIPPNQPSVGIVTNQGLSPDDIERAACALDALGTTEVSLAASTPPDEWGLDIRVRARVASYVYSRKETFPRVLRPQGGP